MAKYNRIIPDKEKYIREHVSPTRPPRLEGVVKEAMMQPVRKKKRVAKRHDLER